LAASARVEAPAVAASDEDHVDLDFVAASDDVMPLGGRDHLSMPEPVDGGRNVLSVEPIREQHPNGLPAWKRIPARVGPQ
jgi:hypothetical protein